MINSAFLLNMFSTLQYIGNILEAKHPLPFPVSTVGLIRKPPFPLRKAKISENSLAFREISRKFFVFTKVFVFAKVFAKIFVFEKVFCFREKFCFPVQFSRKFFVFPKFFTKSFRFRVFLSNIKLCFGSRYTFS
jgi:hypothetical protein